MNAVLPLKMGPYDAFVGANSCMWHQHCYHWYHMTKMSCHTLFWSSWPNKSMVSLMMLPESHDADAGTNYITWVKSHVVPCFNFLDLIMQWCHWQHFRYQVMLMPVPVASHNQKSHLPLCHSSSYNKCSAAIDNAISITWCWHQFQEGHMTKMSCCTLFWLSWPDGCTGTFDISIGITWHQC